NSLSRDIGDGYGNMRWAELNEIIVVTADRTCCPANSLNLDSWHRRQGTGEELVLNFASNGNLVLQATALVFLFNELADRTGHPIKGFAQLAQLVAVLDLNAMREVHGLHILRPAVKIGHC